MDAGKERQIIRLWNQLRLLEREGRPTEAVRRQIEQGARRTRVSCRLTVGESAPAPSAPGE